MPPGKIVPFTPWAEVQKCIERKLAKVDFAAMAERSITRGLGNV